MDWCDTLLSVRSRLRALMPCLGGEHMVTVKAPAEFAVRMLCRRGLPAPEASNASGGRPELRCFDRSVTSSPTVAVIHLDRPARSIFQPGWLDAARDRRGTVPRPSPSIAYYPGRDESGERYARRTPPQCPRSNFFTRLPNAWRICRHSVLVRPHQPWLTPSSRRWPCVRPSIRHGFQR
jgi:hypothetical protein